MQWSPQQQKALQAAISWANDRRAKQVLRLFGWAGTGKTTLAKEIAAAAQGSVLFGAFTGKAALVLRSKGCVGASTIHSMIYKVIEDPETGEREFKLNPDSEVGIASLVIIDECSMVDQQLGLDLLSFGTKVLVLGDPFQLPPVGGAGFFTNHEPDIMLTEIHRQAADNPIIRMSIDVREGRWLRPGQYGESRVVRREEIAREDLAALSLEADQVLVGRNRTRRTLNARMRQLKGFTSDMPQERDRLVCLKNNRMKGLLNGGIWSVVKAANDNRKVTMEVLPQDDPYLTAPIEVETPCEFFRGEEDKLHWKVRKQADEFDFGYALTCHKAQGSQWNNVVVFDESAAFRDDAERWLYTAVTRAAERVTVIA